MEYTCSACGKKVPRELTTFIAHTENHIVDILKKRHPDWVEDGGLCEKCYDYYKKQLRPD